MSVDDKSTYNFTFAPFVGYYINNKLAFGASINTNLYGETTPSSSPTDPEEVYSQSTIGFAPFVRYHFIEMGSLSIFGQASIGLSFNSSTTKTGNVSVDNPSITTFNIGIKPGVAYKLAEHVSIEAFIGELNYNNNSALTKASGVGTSDIKHSTNKFDFNITSSLNLGFVYKF